MGWNGGAEEVAAGGGGIGFGGGGIVGPTKSGFDSGSR